MKARAECSERNDGSVKKKRVGVRSRDYEISKLGNRSSYILNQ